MKLPATLQFILSSILLQPFNPKTTRVFRYTYDYIVVGAGSAGSVVASRLSENPGVNVLLLEAGPEAENITEVPTFSMFATEEKNDWNYMSIPLKSGALKIKDRRFSIPRGFGLGGTNLLNSMLYVRGNKRDYDAWAANGATGWSWNDVYPYFLKSEGNTNKEFLKNGCHNSRGDLTVQDIQYNSTIISAFAKAGIERGNEYRDTNCRKQTGYYKVQGTTRNGRRCTSSKAFVHKVQDRTNLDIVINALVTRILIKNKEAYGVLFELENKQYEVHATKEVIVCGGVINSPQLLMLSGIGHRDHLEDLGIPVIADLPVGDNLHNHLGTEFLHFEAPVADGFLKRLFSDASEAISDFNNFGTGILTSLAGVEGMAFFNSKHNDRRLDWPDLQLLLYSFFPPMISRETLRISEDVYNEVYGPYVNKTIFKLFPTFLRPKSRGTVRLNSTNPKNHPLIDVNIFQVKEDIDRLVEAMHESVNIVTKTKAFQEIGAKMFQQKFPGCEDHDLYSEDYLRCIAINYPSLYHHLVGTCKMGSRSDKTAVVDPRLKVIGVDRLRVVDGSIVPAITSGNTNAPIIMIGEKASDMIKEENAWT